MDKDFMIRLLRAKKTDLCFKELVLNQICFHLEILVFSSLICIKTIKRYWQDACATACAMRVALLIVTRL
jgi:hypothetical protein